ncbi:hypothetical protein [Sphingomonas oryzagri]
MTERTKLADRNQADAPGNSAASTAGLRPTDKTTDQREQDDVPLSAGAVRNGGAYQGGNSPADAIENSDETDDPLDSREHFGGDGAQYAADDDEDGANRPQPRGLNAGDDGYDETAHPDVTQEAD